MARSTKRASFFADLEHLKNTFDALDPDHTGYIGYNEVATLAKTECNMEESLIPELIEKLDRNKDGKVSFEDVQLLFEIEVETTKKQKLEDAMEDIHPNPAEISTIAADYSTSLEYNSAFDTMPSEIVASPSATEEGEESDNSFRTPTVVLRHKRPSRWSTGRIQGRGYTSDAGFTTLSPILAGGTPPSGAKSPTSDREPDLATQMSYLTNIPESPKLKRGSKVLSWISETEDMFEDTGANKEETDGILSPPLSPSYGGGEEVAHVKSILERVCETQQVDQDAVAKLCAHVKADPQEQKELLALLEHLDEEHKGHVTLDDFVEALQSLKHRAQVAAFTPPQSEFRRNSDMPIPKLSEPFSTPGRSKRESLPHFSSTPLSSYRSTDMYGDRPLLTVLDPGNSGYVHVDNLAKHWQQIGVEPPHNQSLEEAIAQRLPVDSTHRISVSDVATSLETAVLSDDKSQNTLRQAALQTFKEEIAQLRSQIYQLSMERDNLRSNLNRTTEEKERLVQEGDEHLDHITKQAQKEAKEKELQMNERVREIEQKKYEEIKQLQEIAERQVEQIKLKNIELKANEQWMRSEMKLTQEEAKRRITQAKRELMDASKKQDRLERMDVEQTDDCGERQRIEELEQENSNLLEQNKELQEQNRGLQDRVDELSEDNEKIKQKYIFQKRRLQRQRSEPRKLGSASLSASKLEEDRRSRPKSGKRPSSAGRRSATHLPPSSLALISENMDTRLVKEIDDFESTEKPYVEEEEDITVDRSEDDSADQMSSSDDGLCAKSTASLMEEFQIEDDKTKLERDLERSRLEMEELVDSCHVLEQRLRVSEEEKERSSHELHRQLEMKRRRQEELEKYIKNLESQKRRLSNTTTEIDTQLGRAEDALLQQLQQIRELKQIMLNKESSSTELQKSNEQRRLAWKEYQHRTSVVELEGKLASAEHQIASYAALHEKACAQNEKLDKELNEFKSSLNDQTREHEEDIRRLNQQLQETKQQYFVKEKDLNKANERLGKELHSSQLALEQYKHDAQSLENQLQRSVQAVKAKEKEIIRLNEQIAQHRPVLQPVDNEDLLKLQENQQQQWKRDTDIGVAEVHRAREEEFRELHLKLATAKEENDTMSRQHVHQLQEMKRKLHNEISLCRQEREAKVTSVRSSLERELQIAKERYDIQAEQIRQELKGTQWNHSQVKSKLELAEQQCESLLLQASRNKETESGQKRQISELQAMKIDYVKELSMLQKSIEEKDVKLTHMARIEAQLHNQVDTLQEQLKQSQRRQAVIASDFALEDTDYSLQAPPPISPITSPSRHSYQSDKSYHEEVVLQMKSQLEELQTMLIHQQSSPNKANEMSLVQELISNNSLLKEELERAQRERERETDFVALKDLEVEELRAKQQQHGTLLQRMSHEIEKKLEEALKALQMKTDASLDDCFAKIQSATHSTSLMTRTLKDMEECHTNALESLFSELSESRSVQEGYQQEISQLKTNLEQSMDEFSFSELELKEQLQTKENEFLSLKDKLQQMQDNYNALQIQARELEQQSGSHEEPHLPSDQQPVRINTHSMEHERDTQEHMLQQKNKEMDVLREEAKRVQMLQQEAQDEAKKIVDLLRQKEGQMKEMESAILQKEQEIHGLQYKLDTVVNEPVEAVVQYMELAPLESVNDAVFVSLQKEIQAERRRSLTQEKQHKTDIDKLNEELDHSLSDTSQQSEHIYALKQAVQEQEAELRQMHKEMEEEKQSYINEQKEIQAHLEKKHTKELEAVYEEIKLYKNCIKAICGRLVPIPSEEGELNYVGLVKDAQDEVKALLKKLNEDQGTTEELQASLKHIQKDHEEQEMHWQTEHEEEVRALQQRNDLLQGQVEDTRIQCQEYISDQENQTAMLQQEMLNREAKLHQQLQEKTRELDSRDYKMESLSEQRLVLLNIIEQLCDETQKALQVPFKFE